MITTIITAAIAIIASIGTIDGSGSEFALSPDRQASFVKEGFADARFFYYVGDDPVSSFPFVLPGPSAPFAGGTKWAGPTLVRSKLVLSLEKVRKKEPYVLDIYLTGVDWEEGMRLQLTANGIEMTQKISPDTRRLSFKLDSGVLKDGVNLLELRLFDGTAIYFDAITLSGDPRTKAVKTGDDPIVTLCPAPYKIELPGGVVSNAVLVRAISKDEGRISVVSGGDTSRYDLRQGENLLEIPLRQNGIVTVKNESGILAKATVSVQDVPVRKSIDYVDLMMGSSGSRWMIGPGPWMPFGMVKIMPDNEDYHWKSGYEDNVDNIMGFSHIHEWTMAGLLTMPTNGKLLLQPGTEKDPDAGYRSRMDKHSETARIGYYGVELTDYNIKAELTATTRASFQRYTFHEADNSRVLVDFLFPAEYPWTVTEACVDKVSGNRLEGSVKTRSWGSGYHGNQVYTLHFVMESDRPFKAMNAWEGERIMKDVDKVDGLSDDCGVWLDYDLQAGDRVMLRTGISLVSVENAGKNLQTEISDPFGWSFEAVEAAQRETWQTLFDRIKVYTPDALLKKKFYTNLYRSISPRTIWNDVNGEWIDMNGNLAVVEKGKEVYGGDSLWGTHWDLGPFYNILYPEFMSNWLYTFEEFYKRGGWLPVGDPGMKYFRVMVGAPAVSFISSAYQHGIRDFDIPLLAEAVAHQQTATMETWEDGTQVGNESYPDYINLGYVPLYSGIYDFDGPHYQSYVSNTMEYAFQDWCAARFLGKNGYPSLADTLEARSGSWKNLFDTSTGFIRPRQEDGSFIEKFDPYRAPGFCEGSSWQFTWYVPQDLPGLISLMGERNFIDKLDKGMAESAKANFNATGDDFTKAAINHGNQTNMQSAYLFSYTSEPYRTNKWAREIQERYYGLGERDAYPGDEDQGQMSSWYVLNSLGFFEMDGGCSDDPVLCVGSPAFERVEISLSPKYYGSKTLILKAPGTSTVNRYVSAIEIDGRDVDKVFVPWSLLRNGGELTFSMSPRP